MPDCFIERVMEKDFPDADKTVLEGVKERAQKNLKKIFGCAMKNNDSKLSIYLSACNVQTDKSSYRI